MLWLAAMSCVEGPLVVAEETACDLGEPGCGALPPRATERRCLAGIASVDALPERWSESGCVEDGAPTPDLVPYEVISPLWSDGAEKGRWVVLDPDDRIGWSAEGPWTFPVGTALIKEFAVSPAPGDAPSPLETRVMLQTDDGWAFRTYVWQGGDAALVEDGVEIPVADDLSWEVPAPDECTYCHAHGNEVLGPRTAELDRQASYGGRAAEQLEAMDAIGLFEGYAPSDAPVLVDPRDEGAPLEERARSWLHANCAHCHQPGGWTPPGMTLDLRFERTLAETRTCGVEAQYWAHEPRIAPGSPERSELWQRLIRGSGEGGMPPYNTQRPDVAGIELVAEWIRSLRSCPEPELHRRTGAPSGREG